MRAKELLKSGIIIFTLGMTMFLLLKCGKDKIINTSSSGGSFKPEYPTLNDTIPYDLLGKGKIVFQRKGPQPHGYSAVYVLDVDQHTAWIDSNASDQGTISPNGDLVAFSAFSNMISLWNIYTVGIHNQNRRQITNLMMFEKFPSWAPDGNQLYFWGDGKENDPATYLFKISPSATYTQPETIIKFTDHFPSGRLGISVSGKITYVTHSFSSNTQNGLYIVDADGSNHHLILPETDSLKFESPVFSRDEQYIYFLRVLRPVLPNHQKGPYHRVDLMKVDIHGSNAIPIARFPASGRLEWSDGQYLLKDNGTYLAQSPDGQKFLLNLPGGDYVSHLYVVNTDGSTLTQVTSADSVTDRCVSWGR